MSSMIVVNFATGPYLKGQQRLLQSIYKRELMQPALMLSDYTSIGSPTHKQSPYEFKVHAIEAARKFDPVVLWVDSSMWLVGDLRVIKDIILTDGYFMSEAGHYVGRWTNQHTRNYFKLTEEELKQGTGGMIMFSAGLLGLDFTNPIALEFFNQWKASAKAGCFKGSWEDHRHDMSCASIIAQRMGLKYQRGGQHMAYIGEGYSKPEPEVVMYLQGLH